MKSRGMLQGETVRSFTSKFDLFTMLSDAIAGRRYRIPILLLFLCVGFVGRSAAANTDARKLPVASNGPGLPFAIADFDGDLRPDLASVQTGRSDFSHTDYWIELQLSAVGRQSIQLVAPAGGLVIEARDVNGDQAVDLVIATALFRQPVAIFLNDGHGSFLRAETTAFPEAFSEPKTNWDSATNVATDTLGVPPQSRVGVCPQGKDSARGASPSELVPPSSAGFPASRFLVSQPGRAPPSEVSHL